MISPKAGILFILLPLAIFSFGNNGTKPVVDQNLQEVNGKIEAYLQLSSELVNKNLDSAMYYAEQAQKLIINLESDQAKIDVYKNLGDVYVARGNIALSLNYYFDTKKLIDKQLLSDPNNIQAIESQINILTKIGAAYYYQKNYRQALNNYHEAMQVLEKAGIIATGSGPGFKLKLLNNIAAVYTQQAEYDQALAYYISALEENTRDGNEQIESSLCNNIGICYLEKKEFSLSNHYFQRALAIREKLGDKRGIAQVFNNIGKNNVYVGKLNEAKYYFDEALKLGREIGNKESMLISLQSLSNIHETLGNYRQALAAFREFKAINDSLFNIESINKIAQLEMQYKFEKQEKLFDLELKRKEAEKKKSELLYLITGGSLFFLLLTALLLNFLQQTKIKNTRLMKEKLELENKHIQLEKQKLKEDLEFKNRELTTNVMYLLKKNELITGISEKLIKSKLDFKVENQKIIQEIINELKSSQDKDVWSEFEAHFTQVHVEFYHRLNELFPNLTSNEKKLCAFLRLNMSTKDISAITYQSVNSIVVARSRLRKKMNIQGEDINLINFLMQL